MAVVISLFSLLHFFVFISAIGFYVFAYKKQSYGSQETISFISAVFLIGIIGFFVSNHMAFLSDEPSILMCMGYSIIPITQFSFALLTYSIVQILNKNNEDSIKYAPIFLGILASAPVSLLLTTFLSQFYWVFLGRSIYG